MVALSSAESEFCSCVRGAGRLLGLQQVFVDLGVPGLKLNLFTDASAALAMTKRRGAGKVRHVEVQTLWLQDQIRCGKISALKIGGAQNSANLGTKVLASADQIELLLGKFLKDWILV